MCSESVDYMLLFFLNSAICVNLHSGWVEVHMGQCTDLFEGHRNDK